MSLHTCPRALLRELDHVFPGVDLDACLAMPTNQKAVMDLVAMGDTVETEKDVLLNSVRGDWRICCVSSGDRCIMKYEKLVCSPCSHMTTEADF